MCKTPKNPNRQPCKALVAPPTATIVFAPALNKARSLISNVTNKFSQEDGELVIAVEQMSCYFQMMAIHAEGSTNAAGRFLEIPGKVAHEFGPVLTKLEDKTAKAEARALKAEKMAAELDAEIKEKTRLMRLAVEEQVRLSRIVEEQKMRLSEIRGSDEPSSNGCRIM